MVGEPWVLKLHLLDKVSGGVPVREGGVPALLEERGEQALVRAVQEVEAGALQPGGRRRRARLLQERGHSAAAALLCPLDLDGNMLYIPAATRGMGNSL